MLYLTDIKIHISINKHQMWSIVHKNIHNVYSHRIFLDVFSLADERISVVEDKREEELQAEGKPWRHVLKHLLSLDRGEHVAV